MYGTSYNRRNRCGRTTIRSYTSTALCVAVATGYSCTSSNESIGRSSLNVDGTVSGASPYISRVSDGMESLQKKKALTKVRRISCRRGLFDARTIRFPESFLIAGSLRACGRMCSDIVVVVEERKRFQVYATTLE